MTDWNGNGKQDPFDEIIDYELYRQSVGDEGLHMDGLSWLLLAAALLIGAVVFLAGV